MSLATIRLQKEVEKPFDPVEHNMALWRELDETKYFVSGLRSIVRELQDRAMEIGGEKALELLAQCKVINKVIITIEKGTKYE
jgi:hypothetical protein